MTAPTIGSREAIRHAAQRLEAATRTATPCPPVRDLMYEDMSYASGDGLGSISCTFSTGEDA